MKKLLVLFALFQYPSAVAPSRVDTVPPGPEFWRMVENHCVAVLTEEHTVKQPSIMMGDRVPEMDEQGNYIVHVPEQTLKLRCK